jgi:hypothetical protein
MTMTHERDDLDVILDRLSPGLRAKLDDEAQRFASLDEVRRAGYAPDAPLCSGHSHDDK